MLKTVVPLGIGLTLATTAAGQILETGIAPPPAGKAQIVVFRGGGSKGSPISCAIRENGVKLSSLPPHHFVVLPLEPGLHSLSVKSETTSTITDNFHAGATSYAECTIGAGILVERPHLRKSNREAFMATLPELKASAPE